MQNNCINSSENRYFSCRKEAAKYNDLLNSRAGAADLLNVSESSLRNYELGLAPVPEDVVVRMADLYNAPELENHYCMNECPIGKRIGSTLSCNVKKLDRIACSFLYHSEDGKLNEIRNTILRIASDGELDQEEKEEMQEAVEYLEYLSRDINDMKLLLQKRETNGHDSKNTGNSPQGIRNKHG